MLPWNLQLQFKLQQNDFCLINGNDLLDQNINTSKELNTDKTDLSFKSQDTNLT